MNEDKNPKLSVYSLDHLKPEVVAVAFAKCSRSPDSFADIAAELTDEKSADFHEKWVVGYGHSSVAEHATLHMAIENVSNLATKIIEDNRLCSYTEKSSRYQIFDKTRYYKPKRIMDSKWGAEYEKTIDTIFSIYEAMAEPMKQFILKKYPIKENENEKAYNAVIKARTCDNIRYLLPTATLTNLGMTANARNLEHAIVKLLSSPIDEMRDIGQALKTEALKITPTLIRFANENIYQKETYAALKSAALSIFKNEAAEPAAPVEVVDYDKDAENKLVAALLYKHSFLPFKQVLARVKTMSKEEKEKIVDEALSRRADFDAPIRELEHIYYTFDILMDFGAFRDIQRHRLCTQTSQPITVIHGFNTPEEIIEAGMEKQCDEAAERSADLYNKLYPDFPEESQYAVLFGFRNKRTLFTWNLRELHHFISLRSGPKGHISYRRIAQACWQRINELHPLLAKYIRVNMEGGSSSWASNLFSAKHSYKPKN